MRALAAAVLLAFAAQAAADDQAFGRLFDGSRAASLPRFDFVRPPSPPPSVVEEALLPTLVPADLAAARSRVGIDAQLARLAAAPASERFVFGVIGDAEPGRFPWERVFAPGMHAFEGQMASLQAASPDFILQLGDFVSEGTPENYRAHVAWLDAASRVPLLRCIGNHDRSRPNGRADKNLYDAVFGPRDYFFDRGGWRFIALDSSDRGLTGSQLAWLKTALDSPARKVIFTHVPPAYLRHHRSAAASAEPDEISHGGLKDFLTNYFKDGSSEFETLVSAPEARVASVYMGHIHAFWYGDHRGVRYVISGGGGSPLYPLPPGYPHRKFAHTMTVEASADGLVETVRPLRGEPFVLPPVRR